MKRTLQYSLLFLFFSLAFESHAQEATIKDSVVQLYGVIMTADSLQAIPSASIIVEDKGRGTFTNDHGVFSIVVLKGDKIRFSKRGSITGNRYGLFASNNYKTKANKIAV